ncbi:hypothetical protein AAVH_13166 [Aphelenchoides avenae]|nr:hypothetical protein AAVH_13166 [Aphelenchus avenae]
MRVKRQWGWPGMGMMNPFQSMMNPFGGFGGGMNPWAPRPRPRPRGRKSEVVHIVKALPPGSTVNVERINIRKARPLWEYG